MKTHFTQKQIAKRVIHNVNTTMTTKTPAMATETKTTSLDGNVVVDTFFRMHAASREKLIS